VADHLSAPANADGSENSRRRVGSNLLALLAATIDAGVFISSEEAPPHTGGGRRRLCGSGFHLPPATGLAGLLRPRMLQIYQHLIQSFRGGA
jgi:hypothetical protein